MMKILGMLLMLFGFIQCASTKFDNNPPFKIEKAVFTNWVGGQPGIRGTRVEIYLNTRVHIKFDTLYFKNKSAKIDTEIIEGKTLLVAHYSTSKQKNDFILNSDSRKELHNNIPIIEKTPFELKENEGVLSYHSEGEIRYLKIEKIIQQKSNFYPRAKN